MIDARTLEDMARRFVEGLPVGVRQLQADLEKNVQVALQGAFTRLELVTREEFEVQQAVLARTRMRLETLEKRVESLEAALATEAPRSAGSPTQAGGGESQTEGLGGLHKSGESSAREVGEDDPQAGAIGGLYKTE